MLEEGGVRCFFVFGCLAGFFFLVLVEGLLCLSLWESILVSCQVYCHCGKSAGMPFT